jgi:hypothetical protein
MLPAPASIQLRSSSRRRRAGVRVARPRGRRADVPLASIFRNGRTVIFQPCLMIFGCLVSGFGQAGSPALRVAGAPGSWSSRWEIGFRVQGAGPDGCARVVIVSAQGQAGAIEECFQAATNRGRARPLPGPRLPSLVCPHHPGMAAANYLALYRPNRVTRTAPANVTGATPPWMDGQLARHVPGSGDPVIYGMRDRRAGDVIEHINEGGVPRLGFSVINRHQADLLDHRLLNIGGGCAASVPHRSV